ncbi:MAG: hypothetical protein JEY79_17990 [Pseudodesulfovibrio sp.]|nr:hypothetical protein [Pseudodesulfovibrio sp.]
MKHTPGLTDEEIMEMAEKYIRSAGSNWEFYDAIEDDGSIEDFARDIEKAAIAKAKGE